MFGLVGGYWESTVSPTVSEDVIHDHLRNLNIHKSTGPDVKYPRALRKLADVVAEPLQPSAETREGTGVNITCSLPHLQRTDYIYWYHQLPGRAPESLGFIHVGSKELQYLAGRLSVSADRRSSTLWLARPRYGDAAVYYCKMLLRLCGDGYNP
uniref:Ig-like domain-containing protein n=1 Tax=Coturnix japonica TaxID=93934 RepID=A0A8C2U8B7_COTJA